MLNPVDGTDSTINNLSEDEALHEYDKLFNLEIRNIVNAYNNLGRLLELLEQAGYSRTNAINKIATDANNSGLKGFSERSIYRMLPEEIKKETGRPKSLPNDKLSHVKTAPSEIKLGKKKVRLPGQTVDMYEHTPEPEEEIAAFNQQVREEVTHTHEPESVSKLKERIAELEKRLISTEEARKATKEDFDRLREKTDMLQEALKKSSFSSASELPQQEQPQQSEQTKRKHEQGIIPFALAEQLSRFLMSRLIGMARGNGDPGVIFKINDQGHAYFP